MPRSVWDPPPARSRLVLIPAGMLVLALSAGVFAAEAMGGEGQYLLAWVAVMAVFAWINFHLVSRAVDRGEASVAQFWGPALALIAISMTTESTYLAAFGRPTEVVVTTVVRCDDVPEDRCHEHVRLAGAGPSEPDLGITTCGRERLTVGDRIVAEVDPLGLFPPKPPGCGTSGWWALVWLPAVAAVILLFLGLAQATRRRE